MLTLNLGPVAAPIGPLLASAALLVAALAAALAAPRRQAGTGGTLADMLVAGVVVARIGFVVSWFDIYRHSPWSMLDIRDGGFVLWAGIVGALLMGAWRAWRRPPLRKPLAVGVAAGALAWGALLGALSTMETESAALPAVPLTTLAGAPTQLAALSDGKPMVVNLWASWCPPCRREMPVLAAAQQRQAGVQFVFVNQGEAGATARRYLADGGLAITNVLLDPGARLGKAVGSRALPTTLFYDADGRLVDTHLGALSPATLASKLARLRPPTDLSPKE